LVSEERVVITYLIGSASIDVRSSYLMITHLISMVSIIEASLSAIDSKITRKKAALSFLNFTSAFQS
jgi:hypothetical protein